MCIVMLFWPFDLQPWKYDLHLEKLVLLRDYKWQCLHILWPYQANIRPVHWKVILTFDLNIMTIILKFLLKSCINIIIMTKIIWFVKVDFSLWNRVYKLLFSSAEYSVSTLFLKLKENTWYTRQIVMWCTDD